MIEQVPATRVQTSGPPGPFPTALLPSVIVPVAVLGETQELTFFFLYR